MMASLKQQLEKKALSFKDINDFLIRLGETDMPDEKFQAELDAKSYVPIEWLGLLADYVCISRKQLEVKKAQVEKKLNVSADQLPFKGYDRGFLAGQVKMIKELLKK